MKNLLIILVGIFTLFSFQVKASGDGADLFKIDEVKINQEMQDLNTLESYVLENNGVTLMELQSDENPLVQNIIPGSENILSISGQNGGITSFLWGFCLGPIGVAIVYFLIDEDELMMSVIGCLVSSVLFGGGYLTVGL